MQMVLVKWMKTCCFRPLAALEIQFLVNPSCCIMKFRTEKLLSIIIRPCLHVSRPEVLSIPAKPRATPLPLNYICCLMLPSLRLNLASGSRAFYIFHLSADCQERERCRRAPPVLECNFRGCLWHSRGSVVLHENTPLLFIKCNITSPLLRLPTSPFDVKWTL